MSTKAKTGFIPVTGGKVWYQIVGTKKAIPLLVLHGGPGYPHDYLEPLVDLASNRPVIFYDQLGCGKSDRPTDQTLWTVKRFVTEIGQVIAVLGLKQYHLLGQSWGAALAVAYGATNPLGLTSIILADPFLSTSIWLADARRLIETMPKHMQMALKKRMANEPVAPAEYHNAAQTYYRQFVQRLDQWPEAVKRAEQGANAAIYQQMWGPEEFFITGTLQDYDCTNDLSKLLCPVLFLSGRYDEATPEALAKFHKQTPRSAVHIFEQSAHFPFWTERAAFLQIIADFLSQTTAVSNR